MWRDYSTTLLQILASSVHFHADPAHQHPFMVAKVANQVSTSYRTSTILQAVVSPAMPTVRSAGVLSQQTVLKLLEDSTFPAVAHQGSEIRSLAILAVQLVKEQRRTAPVAYMILQDSTATNWT